MQQIKKLSTCLLYVLNVWIIFKLGILLAEWLFLDTPTVKGFLSDGLIANPIRTPEGILTLGDVVWTNLSKTVFIASNIVGSISFFLSLFVLKAIFKNYRKGEIFTRKNATSYRSLGLLLFLDSLLGPLSEGLMVVAVTLSNAPGHRYLTLSFGTPSLETLFYGIIVISWVMGEASRLQEDQHLTI
jgi:hypothetical protein